MKTSQPESKPRMHRGAKPKLFQYARNHRDNPTNTEALLWEALRDKRLGNYKIRRQHPIGKYILDFYCHRKRLAIEIDGGYHFCAEQMQRDEIRTEVLKELGVTVIRFTNEAVEREFSLVLSEILAVLESLADGQIQLDAPELDLPE